eukprot:TRINITY_DN4700_c0_g1_i3.p1 TRINITY_DN4700_c0_g1~~TRINITY_DN4700_c0_g1_i3.p1  ORF type:complete len:260 (-),score=58.59 TRINITY_DN4700_c0_g1_i3:509-1288(-)
MVKPNENLTLLFAGSFDVLLLLVAEHLASGKNVAIKVTNKARMLGGSEEQLRREIEAHKRLKNHRHVVQLLEVIETDRHVLMVMELVSAENGDFFDFVIARGRLDENQARKFFQQVISVVEHCHKQGVIYRDVKIENAMLDSREDIYMLNFDLSDVMVNERFSGCKGGSIPYAGPEVFDDVVPSDSVAPAYDVWSCGVVLYVLLVGRFPFDCERILDSFNRIKGGIYEIPDFVSNEARDLISKMLVVDPARRITVEQIK